MGVTSFYNCFLYKFCALHGRAEKRFYGKITTFRIITWQDGNWQGLPIEKLRIAFVRYQTAGVREIKKPWEL